MRVPLPAVLLTLALVAAGCITPGSEVPVGNTTPAVKVGPIDPIILQHNHTNASEHAEMVHNMEVLAWNPLVEAGKWPMAHAVDMWQDYLFVQTGGDHIGFVILNVSDPTNLVEVGRYTNPLTKSGDRCIMVSEDGKYVFLAADESEKGGIYAVDISDMANPTDVAYYEIPQYGAHTLFAKMIDGDYYVYALSFGVHILRFEDQVLGGKGFTLVSRYATADPLQVAQFRETDQGGEASYIVRDLYGHDLYVTHEEGRTLMYVAFAYDGFKIVDITNPMAPRELSKWVPQDEHAPYYVHTVDVAHIGDRVIAAVGSEVFENRHTEAPSPVWFLDVTDPAKPVHLGTWVNPGEAGSMGLLLSAHDMRIENGRVYLSHYHGGIWILDISTPEKQAAPEVLGYSAASNDNGYQIPENCCFGFGLGAMPVFFDVEVKNGVAFGADLFSGVYALRLQDPEGGVPFES